MHLQMTGAIIWSWPLCLELAQPGQTKDALHGEGATPRLSAFSGCSWEMGWTGRDVDFGGIGTDWVGYLCCCSDAAAGARLLLVLAVVVVVVVVVLVVVLVVVVVVVVPCGRHCAGLGSNVCVFFSPVLFFLLPVLSWWTWMGRNSL